MSGTSGDPLALGQRIVAILEMGARVATYKLATLTALIDHSIENLPADPDSELEVLIPDLARRVLELYWSQVRPFDGVDLKQTTGSAARILREAVELRAAAGAGHTGMAIDAAKSRASARYETAVREIGLTLAQQPLHRLQRVGLSHDAFLYEDGWLNSSLTRRQLEAHGNAIVLKPGVPYALARLSGLLKPALEILWVEDVRRMNKLHFDSKGEDLTNHLFGRERVSLARVRDGLKEQYGPRCFYCDAKLPGDSPVDHVLPWSRLGIDGLANLVLSCRRCNGDKLHALPSLHLVDRALGRDRLTLEEIATAIEWPTQYDRLAAAVRGIYRGEPVGALTWDGYQRSTRLDLAYAPGWLHVDVL